MKNPGLKILDRYIIRKFLGTYVFLLALIIVIVVVFDYAEKVDDFISQKAPFKDIILDYYVNFIPFFINQFSGLFTFITVIYFTSKMAYQTEIIAILSSGVSFKRLMWPYFISAAVIATVSIGLNMWIIPHTNIKRVEFESQYIPRKKNVKYDKHIYRQIEHGTFVYIRNFSGSTQKANFMAIEKYDGTSLVQALEAGDVTYNPENGHWTAPKYSVRSFDSLRETYTQYVALDTLINLNTEELGNVAELIKTMQIGLLTDFIRQQKDKGSDMIPLFEVERHGRIAYPMAAFILTLIGVSISSRKVRGGTGLHMGMGIVLCFSYILFQRFAEEFAKGGSLPAGLSVWIPNIIFAVIAVFLYKKAPK